MYYLSRLFISCVVKSGVRKASFRSATAEALDALQMAANQAVQVARFARERLFERKNMFWVFERRNMFFAKYENE